MTFVPFLVMVALNKKLVDFVKELLPNDLANKTIQAIAWAVGIGLAFAFAWSDFGSMIPVVQGRTLDQLDAWAVATPTRHPMARCSHGGGGSGRHDAADP
jgi:hypothetical protein